MPCAWVADVESIIAKRGRAEATPWLCSMSDGAVLVCIIVVAVALLVALVMAIWR